MLKVTDLYIKYDSIRAINGVSFSVNEGELVALIGANGAGKSTILKSISGLKPAYGGSITYKGKNITRESSNAIVKSGLIHVPEGRQIFSKMTVEENLKLGAYLEKDSKNEKKNMNKVFELFPRMFERKNQLAGTLSGGEQQMLAIGRALMGNPEFILLDEPSMGLSPLVTEQVFDVIQKLHESGMTILLVEQNAYDALEISDRAYVIETGTITMEGASSELLTNPVIKRAYLGGD